jgi:hypothetical protein
MLEEWQVSIVGLQDNPQVTEEGQEALPSNVILV